LLCDSRRPPRSPPFPTRRSSDLVALGSGNDTLNVQSIAANAVTVLRGNAGNDTFNITAPSTNGMLIVYGDNAANTSFRGAPGDEDRKSTRLNSSHRTISYAVFCL